MKVEIGPAPGYTLAQFCKRFGVSSYSMVRKRILKGWSPLLAVTTPSQVSKGTKKGESFN